MAVISRDLGQLAQTCDKYRRHDGRALSRIVELAIEQAFPGEPAALHVVAVDLVPLAVVRRVLLVDIVPFVRCRVVGGHQLPP
jgi:hypothetical protein